MHETLETPISTLRRPAAPELRRSAIAAACFRTAPPVPDFASWPIGRVAIVYRDLTADHDYAALASGDDTPDLIVRLVGRCFGVPGNLDLAGAKAILVGFLSNLMLIRAASEGGMTGSVPDILELLTPPEAA